MERIPKRASSALLHSLGAGVVPRIGLEYIAVGRRNEVESLLGDLNTLEHGGASFRFIVGAYGSGKSFLLQMMRNHAMERGFAVADADLSPERRLTGTQGQGLATYKELIQHLATRTRPEGGALESALQRWMGAMDPNRPLRTRLAALTSRLEGMVHGFDFAAVVGAYCEAYESGDDEGMQAALRWLRGEYPTRTEARRMLRVGGIVQDDNWYDCLKLMAVFLHEIGYKGLLLCVDEGVNLYKITNRVSRENNYEKLLSLFNDAMQGQASHIGFLLGGTPQFVEDERRGLYSYDALRSRLADSRFAENGIVDYHSPVLRLARLGEEELYVLLKRLSAVHGAHYGYEPAISDAQYLRFLQSALSRVGADELLTPREITRDFISLLNLVQQGQSYDALLDGGFVVQAAAADPDAPRDEFAEFAL